MPTNTAALKTFAQQTRAKLISLITTKLQFVLGQDTAELRGFEKEIEILRKEIQNIGEKNVIEEVAYTWFNRVMALRYMDANGYNTQMTVSPATGQSRPEVLQYAMGGTFDEELHLSNEDKLLPEAKLYRRLLVAICNQKYAEMPFLFERISDYTELLLPDDLLSDQSFVSDIRNGMTCENCKNVELLGWLYQFYIADRKADAEVKKTKKGGLKSDEQAAATQLFTPHWVVRYMVENTLGRIWMTLHHDSPLINCMPYYVPTPKGQVDSIPDDIKSVEDIRFIDPCMGSGHILVYAFDLFTKMYEEEGYQTSEIPELILTHNISGIDIDRRCYQLASFALTMKARAYYSRYLRNAVQPKIIALQNISHGTIASVENWDTKSSMWQFENVDTIGSLLQISIEDCNKIKASDGLFQEQQKILKTQAEYLSRKYHCVVTNPPYLGKGMGDALSAFLKRYYHNSKADTMVAFMERLMAFCSENGKMAMINLPSWMFISTFERLRKTLLNTCHFDSLIHMGRGIFGIDWGSVAFTYSKGQNKGKGVFFRLHHRNFQHIYFQHIGQLFLKVKNNHDFKYDFETYRDEDVSTIDDFDFKYSENGLKLYFESNQADFEKIPGCPIGYWASNGILSLFNNKKLEDIGDARQGMATGDNNRFLRLWFEVVYSKIYFSAISCDDALESGYKWFPHNKGGQCKWFGDNDYLISFDRENFEALSVIGNHLPSKQYYFRPCLSWSVISSRVPTFRYIPQGFTFNMCGMSYFQDSINDLFGSLGYVNSKLFRLLVPIINPTINLSNGDFGRIPFCKSKISIYNNVENNISISKHDWDAHETSWDFQTNELLTIDGSNWQNILNDYSVQTGIYIDPVPADPTFLEWRMRLYKMKWETKFRQLHANEEELNRQFIEIYDLQDELTPDVPLSEITILQKGEISIENNDIVWHEDVVIKQFVSYLVGCFMGRYSIDKPGLIIASQHQDLNSLDLKVEGIDNDASGRLAIDDDGIVPIIEEEGFFADDMTQRIEQAISVIFGEENYHANIKYINEKLGKPLREYLFKDFYADHLDGKMYQKRPIYWLFSSKMGDKKKKGYFKVLIYMHRIESDTLSKLHADYVHPYLTKVERQLTEAQDQTTRDDLTQTQHNKTLKLVEELQDKVREVHAFEQQLVEMASHRLSIDLDDGVKVNYPKYYPLVEPIKGLDKDE